jgi:putative transposase
VSRRRAKCRARATPQQPEAIPAFQATGQEQLQRALPATNTRPVRVCSPDERRVGLLTVRRRRLTARGVRPGGSVPQVFAWCSVYGAVAPATGERFFLERPYLQAARFQLSLDPFAQAFADRLHILRVDHRGAQTARRLTLPDNVPLVVLPPYGPELNPSARVWRDRKNALAWLQGPNREAQQDDIAPLLRGDQAATRQALTGYTYLIAAIYALGTERNHITDADSLAVGPWAFVLLTSSRCHLSPGMGRRCRSSLA